MKPLTLRLHPGRWAACRLPAGSRVPEPPAGVRLWSATWTRDETSLIVPEEHAPEGAPVEKGFVAFEVEGPLDFSLTGILAGLATALAEAGVPLLAMSTFDTDWLLVRQEWLEKAKEALKGCGVECVAAVEEGPTGRC